MPSASIIWQVLSQTEGKKVKSSHDFRKTCHITPTTYNSHNNHLYWRYGEFYTLDSEKQWGRLKE